MSSVAQICSEKMDAIPRWQFWRKWEREFWFGGILAEYAAITGNRQLNDKAEAIFDKYAERLIPNTTGEKE